VPHDAALVVDVVVAAGAADVVADGALSLVDAVDPTDASVVVVASPVDEPPSEAAGAGALEPPLKSVTYQPEPLS
jgi:hypothetical protein